MKATYIKITESTMFVNGLTRSERPLLAASFKSEKEYVDHLLAFKANNIAFESGWIEVQNKEEVLNKLHVGCVSGIHPAPDGCSFNPKLATTGVIDKMVALVSFSEAVEEEKKPFINENAALTMETSKQMFGHTKSFSMPPVEAEQGEKPDLTAIKKQVAIDMGFNLDTDVYKLWFSDYTNEVAKRYSSALQAELSAQKRIVATFQAKHPMYFDLITSIEEERDKAILEVSRLSNELEQSQIDLSSEERRVIELETERDELKAKLEEWAKQSYNL